jgi:hypothetical protein
MLECRSVPFDGDLGGIAVLSSKNFLPARGFRNNRFQERETLRSMAKSIMQQTNDLDIPGQPVRIGCLANRLRIKESLR